MTTLLKYLARTALMLLTISLLKPCFVGVASTSTIPKKTRAAAIISASSMRSTNLLQGAGFC